jgi:predicted nucleic acid-binding protein
MDFMNEYIIDTMALVRYLENNLPGPADKVFKSAEKNECKLLIPEIVMGEFIYISLRGRLKSSDPKSLIMETLISLDASRYIDFLSMDTEAWEEFLALNISELHDRMICATALCRNAKIISNDEEIRNSDKVVSIWD